MKVKVIEVAKRLFDPKIILPGIATVISSQLSANLIDKGVNQIFNLEQRKKKNSFLKKTRVYLSYALKVAFGMIVYSIFANSLPVINLEKKSLETNSFLVDKSFTKIIQTHLEELKKFSKSIGLTVLSFTSIEVLTDWLKSRRNTNSNSSDLKSKSFELIIRIFSLFMKLSSIFLINGNNFQDIPKIVSEVLSPCPCCGVPRLTCFQGGGPLQIFYSKPKSSDEIKNSSLTANIHGLAPV